MWDLFRTRDQTHVPCTGRQILFFFFIIIFFISWRLIILQYCSGFCHTLTWISLADRFLTTGAPGKPHGSTSVTSLRGYRHLNLDVSKTKFFIFSPPKICSTLSFPLLTRWQLHPSGSSGCKSWASSLTLLSHISHPDRQWVPLTLLLKCIWGRTTSHPLPPLPLSFPVIIAADALQSLCIHPCPFLGAHGSAARVLLQPCQSSAQNSPWVPFR